MTSLKATCVFFALGVVNVLANDGADTAGPYTPPEVSDAHFYDTFSSGLSGWAESNNEDYEGEWNVGRVTGATGIPTETGLIAVDAAKKHALSQKFASPLTFDENVVIQYEVRFHDPLTCGGAYIKLLDTRAETQPSGEEFSSESLDNDTPYVIMFGPDKCGTNNKVHFIFRHKNPITGEYEEKHLVDAPRVPGNTLTNLYTLIIRTDNTYEILINQNSERTGNLLEDFQPPVNPPAEIDDPEDIKPEDWIDDEMMKDPEASKPDDWDEDAPPTLPDESVTMPEGWLEEGPYEIVDPSSVEPEDWDEEDDGPWEPAMIKNPVCLDIGCGPWAPPQLPNPDYKGKWIHPMIPNPDYIGVWTPRQIPNPDFFVDNNPHQMTPIGGIGIEIWHMNANIEFDNFYIGHSITGAQEFADLTYAVKADAEAPVESSGFVDDVVNFTSENAIAVAATVCAGVVLLFALFLMSGSSGGAEPATPPAKKTESTEAKEDKAEAKSAESKADNDGDDDGDDDGVEDVQPVEDEGEMD